MTNQRDEIVRELQGLMAEELEAFLRYFQLRFRVPESDRAAAEKIFGHAQQETLEHAGLIAAQIRALDAVPEVRIRMTAADGITSLREAIEESLAFEQQALDAYKDMLQRTSADPKLATFIHGQITIETEHVREIQELLR